MFSFGAAASLVPWPRISLPATIADNRLGEGHRDSNPRVHLRSVIELVAELFGDPCWWRDLQGGHRPLDSFNFHLYIVFSPHAVAKSVSMPGNAAAACPIIEVRHSSMVVSSTPAA